MIRRLGNNGPLAAPSVGGVGKWRGMLEVLEVDVTDGLELSMAELYWFLLFERLTSSVDSVIM